MYPKEKSAPNNPYCLEEISMSISNLPNIPELKPVSLKSFRTEKYTSSVILSTNLLITFR